MIDFIKKVFKSIIQTINDLKIGIIIGIVLYIIASLVGLRMYEVSGSSMYSTLEDGQRVLSIAYHGEDKPQINDIIIFYHEETSMIKRVVGIEGDVIYFKDGNLYRNDELVVEEYLDEGQETICKEEVFVVPEGEVFVLGDNRMNSMDSRFYADPYVDIDDIDGRVIFEF